MATPSFFKRQREGSELQVAIAASEKTQSDLDPWLRKHGELAILVATFDRLERRYGALGTLTGTLAGASAVIAALGVQLLSPHPQHEIVAGVVVGIASFVLAALASLIGTFGNEDRRVRRSEIGPGEHDVDRLDLAITLEKLRVSMLKLAVQNRTFIALLVSLGMVAALVLMAVGRVR